jgi:hypothetical protein
MRRDEDVFCSAGRILSLPPASFSFNFARRVGWINIKSEKLDESVRAPRTSSSASFIISGAISQLLFLYSASAAAFLFVSQRRDFQQLNTLRLLFLQIYAAAADRHTFSLLCGSLFLLGLGRRTAENFDLARTMDSINLKSFSAVHYSRF